MTWFFNKIYLEENKIHVLLSILFVFSVLNFSHRLRRPENCIEQLNILGMRILKSILSYEYSLRMGRRNPMLEFYWSFWSSGPLLGHRSQESVFIKSRMFPALIWSFSPLIYVVSWCWMNRLLLLHLRNAIHVHLVLTAVQPLLIIKEVNTLSDTNSRIWNIPNAEGPSFGLRYGPSSVFFQDDPTYLPSHSLRRKKINLMKKWHRLANERCTFNKN